MKIYNHDKTQILENVDLIKGYLVEDKIVIATIPAEEEVQEQFHYEYKEYPNGGRDRIKVVDVPYKPAKPESYEYEDIQVYCLYTEEELLEVFRAKRETECFSIINRGQLWYNTLTEEQLAELKTWYKAWLDITETRVIPTKPSWIK